MTEPSPASPDLSAAAGPEAGRDVAVALRNGLRLGASLVGTWAVALAVRFQLPRHLGPERFGDFNFAESLAATLFVGLELGVDTYIQRETSVRPGHADDFFGGVVVVRLLASLALFAAMWPVLVHAGKGLDVQIVAAIFGATQLFIVANASFAALMQASTKVGGLAVVNVFTKLVWGGGILAATTLGAPFWSLALPMLAAEALKTAFLFYAARASTSLRVRVDLGATKKVLRASLPFFIGSVAIAIGARLDVTMLEFLTPDTREVGWYGAANNIATLAMLLSPVLSWVLVPLMTRARARSEEEFFGILRRAIEGVMVVALPVTLFLALYAETWVTLAFGHGFAASAVSLQLLAPNFVLTYAAVLLWLALMILGRSWLLTTVSLVGLALLPVLLVLFVPFAAARLGVGGAGVGAAAAISVREGLIVAAFAIALGRRGFDRRAVLALVKSVALCAAVVAADRALLGVVPRVAARLSLECAAYVAAAWGLGILHPDDVRFVVSAVRARRAGKSSDAGAARDDADRAREDRQI